MIFSKGIRLILTWCLIDVISSLAEGKSSRCYEYNKPVRCSPDFTNAAYNKTVISSNTCGRCRLITLFYLCDHKIYQFSLKFEGSFEMEYCQQTSRHSDSDKCDVCDMRFRDKAHPAEHINDYKNEAGLTWWQSETMEYGIQHPNFVNITINLGSFYS